MNVNHLDARAVTHPGGLYASANNGILEALKAYFQFKDRQQAGERDMRRDERRGNNEQTIQAVELARRLGVRPDPSQLGWTSPDHINPLLDAAVQEHALSQQDAERQRATAELQQRMQRIKLAESGAMPPEPTQDEAVAFQRAAQMRAMGDKRQGVTDQTAEARLASAKNEATWNSPTMRSIRGVADWVGDVGKEAVRAAGRQKPISQSWRQGDMGFMSRDLGEGFTASRDPDGNVTIVGPTGQTLTAEQYQRMRGSLEQAVGVPSNPGVDTTAPDASVPAVSAQPMSTDQLVSEANSLPAPPADVLSRNVAADYDSVNRRGITDAFLPQEVRALAERMRMRKTQPTKFTQANVMPSDTEPELIAAFMAQHGGTKESARAALVKYGIIK